MGRGAQPGVYFGKEEAVWGEQSTPCVLPCLRRPPVFLPEAGLICLWWDPLLGPHLK